MKLLIKRFNFTELFTQGKLYVDGSLFCYTCEDKDRLLNNGMTVEQINTIKIKDRTAIPYTTAFAYPIVLNIQSPKYSNFEKYKWASFCNGYIPRLQKVPGYEGVLIHVGNTNKDTSGCILVGDLLTKNGVGNSTICFERLYKKLQEATDEISLTIER